MHADRIRTKQAMKETVHKQVRRVGRAVYWRLPPRWRDAVVDLAFSGAGRMFRGFPAYEAWRQQRLDRAKHVIGVAGRFAELSDVDPLPTPPGRIAVHAHMYYPELAAEFADQLGNMPFPYDLFVSVVDDQGRMTCEAAFTGLPKLDRLTVEIVPNRGRDIAPMLCAFGDRLKDYELLAHVHSKKSLYNKGATDGWRAYLLASLFGSSDRLRRIFGLLSDDTAMVFPQSFHRVPYFAATWLANRATGTAWCHRLGISRIPTSGYFDFPIGSMFWARTDALRPLFEAGVTLDDFEPEAGQSDGTLAHALERLLGLVARDSGMQLAILPDTKTPSWSHWRFDRYLNRGPQAAQATLSDPEVALVIFDIFDTLLIRPLVEPEQIKQIVARRAGGETGRAYLAWRARAEAGARASAGRDVGLEAIYAEMARCAGLDETAISRLRDLEIATELAAVAPRPGALALFDHAVASGKPVVLASDMYLPRATIEAMLERHGFSGWRAFYLSSEIGLRKDTGALYAHILEMHGVKARAALMVGDNERSDLQIPLDQGMRTLHLLRPLELARGMHRLRPLIERVEHSGTLDQHVALGLMIRKGFGRLFPERFDPKAMLPEPDVGALGYAVAGPLALAFAQWLIDAARRDGVQRLYFLAREGQFLKLVYDRVAESAPGAPTSEYLVVSRRAVNLPAIRTLDDMCAIAQTDYGPAPLQDFLLERFGIDLDREMARDLEARGRWRRGRSVEVRQRKIDHLLPLLEALLPAVLAQGERELPGLEAYLHRQGLGEHRASAALVDVGYSGTIQRRLNALLGGVLPGYYMATLEGTASMEADCGAQAQGCYFHQVPDGLEAPLFIRLSFIIEKLFSSDDPQVVRYALDEAGEPRPEYRTLSNAERATREPRAELRAGTMELVDDALLIRASLLPDFVFPTDVALALCEAFIDAPSSSERALLRTLVLDDHYCGRGVVA
jgi:FMN phosphatase YigB (HAD superfamily)